MKRLFLFLSLFCSCLFSQPSKEELLQQHFEQGEKALAEGRYAEAEQAYEKLRQLSPETAEVYAKLGLILFQERKFEQAVPVLRKGLKLKPGLPNADILLAMCLSELGRYTEALPGLEKGFRRSTDAALKRMSGLQLQRAYTGLKRDNKAVEVALELTRLYPDDPEVLYETGRLYGNYAYLAMNRLSRVAPNSVWRHQAAGEAQESQGNFDLAIAEYRSVLALAPNRPGIHFRIGRALLARSQAEDSQTEARKEFEQELQVDPTNANAAYELGESYRKSAQLAQARRFFEQAIRYYPDFEDAHLGLGSVLIDLQMPDQALAHIRKAIALNPANDVSYFRLSQAYRALGDTAEQRKAIAEFQRLRNQNSTQEPKDMTPPRDITRQEVDAKTALP